MQNTEELRQKGHDGSLKQRVARGGKNIIFRRGRGTNIVFGTKYRPLLPYLHRISLKNDIPAVLWCKINS
jgi:hypothetical protein